MFKSIPGTFHTSTGNMTSHVRLKYAQKRVHRQSSTAALLRDVDGALSFQHILAMLGQRVRVVSP
ncbi:hypothetical protein F441_20068 [Phytophthora nicotianae CJ01A1]|uniref:Uncharacterized protein n=3 Tax=Phytophthora nicotianae TaxID=4792 RepID=W2HXE2_PHYNI|nr:hypothetical protein L915_19944 [Phytophthora nicotianae]ETL26521.1 hypothetical protein L916_19824 [Phytophthora nicotianae]ETL77432.1 hypothetical protein L917_21624 [Phytophthora nicotianae]ETO61839.1 hypothetical protein F444_20203 [Phytophthora nicotianae P1976]ETP02922.1 hypothetical protein F441_20068 [Phytophthora nicotianae CJ01A1]